jgi:hypothetical protein
MKKINGGKIMISTFEQVWDKIGGEHKPLMEILETLDEEITQRSHLGHELYEARDFKELTKVEQERSAFIQVQYGIQDLTYLDNGNESDIWKAALAKRPEAQEREKETKARWKANTEAWSALIDAHRSEIEDAIWKASSHAQEGVPGRYEATVRLGGQPLTVYKVTRREDERDVENERFEMSSTKAGQYIDAWKERFLETAAAKETAPQKEEEKDKSLADTMVQEAQQAEIADSEVKSEVKERETSQIRGPNMAEVQAAESKASLIQGLDKSADGLSRVEGRDIGYTEENYVIAANEVKYEAQRARTADGETKGKALENPQVGQRVTFHPHGGNEKNNLTGKVVASDEQTVTLKCGSKKIPAIREKGDFFEAPPLKREQTKTFAQTQARNLMGENSNIFFAQDTGVFKGEIIGKTPTYAIQKVNSETAVLHRLKDLESVQDKDSQGLIREGQEVSIVKDEAGVSITPWSKEREDREKVRERQKSRGAQSR